MTVQLEGNALRVGEETTELTGYELYVARKLAQAPGAIVPYVEIMGDVWPGLEQDDRLRHDLQVHVHRINARARDLGADHGCITVAAGIGYAWSGNDA